MTAAELANFVDAHFPQARDFCQVTDLGEQTIELRLGFRESFLRPGGTISGPTLMGLADTAAYMLILSMIGPVALAVTTSLNINFMRRPTPDDMIAKAKMLKLGRQLAVVETYIESATTGTIVAQATVTYSIPPDASTQV